MDEATIEAIVNNQIQLVKFDEAVVNRFNRTDHMINRVYKLSLVSTLAFILIFIKVYFL